MTRYLVAIHHPDDYNPAVAEDEAMHRDIDVLNDEMVAASVRVLVGGLEPVGRAKSVRNQPKGEVLVTDGPYIETKEHIGGFWVLELATLDEALAWARKAATAYRAPVEVRFMERFNSAFVAHRPQDLDDLIGEGCVLENTARATMGVRHASVSGRKWRPRRATCSKRRRFGQRGPRDHPLAAPLERARRRSRPGVNIVRVRDGKIVEGMGYVKG